VQLELSRLEQLGLVERVPAPDGRVRIRVISRSAAWAPFRALVRTYGDPADLLRLALADVAGIAAAFVFGSVAQGTEGPESDIDLFVVAGAAERAEVRELEQLVARRTVEASLAIGREVNVVVRTGRQLSDKLVARHGFHERILAGPKLWVLGDGRAIATARRAAGTLAALAK
jgi:predicted nucleotidyltransferase